MEERKRDEEKKEKSKKENEEDQRKKDKKKIEEGDTSTWPDPYGAGGGVGSLMGRSGGCRGGRAGIY